MNPTRSIGAALTLCAGLFIYSLQDLIIKSLAGEYPIYEVMLIRSASAVPLLAILVYRVSGLHRLRSGRPGWLIARGLLQTMSYTCYYLAMPALALAKVVALSFTSPLFITVLAMLLLGEKPRWDRWAAVALGGLGMLAMLRPDGDSFELASLLPLIAAMGYALSQMITRHVGLTVPAGIMAFYQNLIFLTAAALMAALFHGGIEGFTHPSAEFFTRAWATPDAGDLAAMLACGAIAAAGALCLAQAYRSAEASYIACFEYTALLWGAMWGWVVFAEKPSAQTIVGATLIVSAGLYMLWSDARQRRASKLK